MEEMTSKSRLWDTNLNRWHDCEKNPADINRRKKEQKSKWERIRKFSSSIWCYTCNKSYKTNEPCSHILADGYEIGVDGCDFYSDSYGASNRRKALKAKKLNDENSEPPKQKKFF